MKSIYSPLFAILITFSGIPSAVAASVTVTPAAITNDFKGYLSINVTGLTPGQMVQIDRYGDLNTNGVIDAGEPVLQSYFVTDGLLPLIGGVRNSSAVGDEDGVTNNQVQLKLFFALDGGAPPVDFVAGNYLIRVSHPLGAFTAQTNSFTVAQQVLPQGISGAVTDQSNGTPLAGAAVFVLSPEGMPAGGSVTDNNGNYTVNCPPGGYSLAVIRNDYFLDLNTTSVTVPTGSFATRNLACTAGVRTISGKVIDSASGTGLAGVFVQAESGNLFAGTFTDAGGNYSVAVNAGTWKIKPDEGAGVANGYVQENRSTNVDATAASVSGVQFQFTKATALIYGTVRDDTNGVPRTRISFMAGDQSNIYRSGGPSLTNGSFGFGVLAGNWSVGPDSDRLSSLGYLGTQTNVVLTNGQALAINFILARADTHLRGQVVDTTGAAVSGLNLIVYQESGGGGNINANTDSTGHFEVLLGGGSWTLGPEQNSAVNFNLVGPFLPINITSGVDVNNVILVVRYSTGQRILGVVTNSSGVPISGINVYASTTLNGTNYATGTSTDGSGHYQLVVVNGAWSVSVDQNFLTAAGYVTPSNQNPIVANNQVTANFVVVPFTNQRPLLNQAVRLVGQFQFQVNGENGRTYRVDGSTNLNSASNWIPLLTNTVFGGSFFFSDPSAPGRPQRFYRAILVP